ncbi:MAG: hypothetical protein ACU84H_08075 [Gammaproteobacteria bacterium]
MSAAQHRKTLNADPNPTVCFFRKTAAGLATDAPLLHGHYVTTISYKPFKDIINDESLKHFLVTSMQPDRKAPQAIFFLTPGEVP